MSPLPRRGMFCENGMRMEGDLHLQQDAQQRFCVRHGALLHTTTVEGIPSNPYPS